MFITNISNDMLVKSNNLPRLITFLNTVNAKNDFDNTIWYSIVPSVSLDQNSNIRLTRQRFQGNENTEKTGTNSVEALVRLLDVLKDYSVQCFSVMKQEIKRLLIIWRQKELKNMKTAAVP